MIVEKNKLGKATRTGVISCVSLTGSSTAAEKLTHGPGTKHVIIETKKLGKATRTDVISYVSLTGSSDVVLN